MSEPFFLPRGAGLSLREIAALTGAKTQPGADLAAAISGFTEVDRAGPSDLCFLDDAGSPERAAACQAGACLTREDLAGFLPPGVTLLLVEEPYAAFVQVAKALFPDGLRPSSLFEASGTATGALIHPSARLEAGVTIDPGAVVGPRAEIGSATLIAAGAVIGPNVHIGRNCAVQSQASITHALIGDRVLIAPGCRIGQAGVDARIPQTGRVIIQDDVVIGANTVIDRGAMSDTVIGEGSKIDNLVQIAHNALIGRCCTLAPRSSVAPYGIVADGAVIGDPLQREHGA